MRLDQFKQLTTIVQHKSISKASEVLNISQPALSISMKNMEKELGFKIFDKSGRTPVLTDKGKDLYISAKRIIQETNIIENLKHDDKDEVEVLSVSNSFTVLAKDAIIDMYNKHGGKFINFKINDCAIHEIIEKVSKGESEIGIIRYPKEKEYMLQQLLAMKNLEHNYLAHQNMCIVVGEKNPLYRIDDNKISLEHIKKYKFATFANEAEDNLWMSFLDSLGINYRGVSLSNVGHIMNMVEKTDIGFIDIRKDHTHTNWYPGARYIELDPNIRCDLCYIHTKNRELSKIGREYISIMKTRLADWEATKDKI